MLADDALPLTHSWPIYDAALHLPRGMLVDPTVDAPWRTEIAAQGIGLWQCDLRDGRLDWTPHVFRLFGLPEDEPICRPLAVSLYEERSRRAMEALRAHIIRHRRGFTLDAQIRRPDGDHRWMRLTALPVIERRKVVRLCGTKRDVTGDYEGPG